MRDLNDALNLLQISYGDFGEYSPVAIEGTNMNISIGSADIWAAGGELVYLTSAEQMNIASLSVNDTLLGTGARTVKIVGLDGSYQQISEVVEMNGTTNVLTTLSYLRVIIMEVVSSGTLEDNEGIIDATSLTSSTVQCAIPATAGLSKNSHFTVPVGKELIILSAEINATKLSGGIAPNIKLNAFLRKLGENPEAPWLNPVSRRLDTSVQDQLLVIQPVGAPITEKSDLRFNAETDQNQTEVRVRYYGVLRDI